MQRETIARTVVIAIAGSVILTFVLPFWMEKSINYYFDGQVSDYQWELYGGPYQVFRIHPAWPEINVPAEWEIVWLGILCCLAFWFHLLMLGQYILGCLKQFGLRLPLDDQTERRHEKVIY